MTNSTIGNQVINGLMKKRDRMDKFVRKHLALVLGFMLMLLAGFQPAVLAQNHNNKPGYGVTGSVANHNVQCTKMLSTDGRQVQFTVSGQMPAQAQVNAVPVQRTAPQGKQVFGAYDITINNGRAEWQPQAGQPVTVSITDPNFTDGQMMDVYHEGANGNEFVATVSPTNHTITFPARSFSVYIVTENGGDARLAVTFVQADGRTTIMVKKNDIDSNGSDSLFNKVLYDPGAGDYDQELVFRGWYRANKNYTYTVADASNAKTIAGVRTDVKSLLNAGVTDGDTVYYYALLYKSFTVTYLDTMGTVLSSENYLKETDVTQMNYTVLQNFTLDDQHTLLGWYVKSGYEGAVVGHVAERLYPNDTTIIITNDVVFTPYLPAGYWLVFDENGKGGTYNAPQFVLADEVTQRPCADNEMIRYGYTFSGWYTDTLSDGSTDSQSEQFEFGNPLNEGTTIYALWTPNTTAPYTVIFWTQNLDRNGYEVAGSYTGQNGTVGQNIPYTSVDNGDEDYVTGFGNNYGHYTGFCLKPSSQNQQVVITPEGDAVLNLYYDRIEYNFKFYLYRDGTQNGRYDYANNSGNGSSLNDLVTWHSNQTAHPSVTGYTIQSETVGGRTYYYFVMNAYYGEDISSKWPTYSQITGANNREAVSYVMMVGTVLKPNPTNQGSGTVKGLITVLNENILGATNDSDGNYVVIRFPDNYYNWRYHIWFETIDGVDYSDYVTHTWNGKTYYEETVLEVRSSNTTVTNQNAPKYSGFDFVDWRGENWNNQNYWTTGNNPTLYHINQVYNRQQYKIAYFDGNYIDGNNNLIQSRSSQLLHESPVIGQGATIAEEYANYVPTLPNGEEGYVFEGWFLDEGCTVEYTWSTMPVGGIQVYAKWRQIQYRVFLHPNAGTDPTLDWGSDSQEMNFRVDYNGTISVPEGLRTGYKWVGWYTDSACTHVFSASTHIKESNTAAYNKEVDFTDDMDKWGNGATYNKDLSRFWITKKFELWGKWRKVVEGANGIGIEYICGSGTNCPDHDKLYVDNTTAIAESAPTAPTDSVFSYWDLQRYDTINNVFVSSGISVFPGGGFTVLIDNSLFTDHPDTSYIIQLKAVYELKEKATPTYIIWYMNDETGTVVRQDGVYENVPGNPIDTLHINQAVSIPTPTNRDGYIFKGWYKARIANLDDVEPTYATGCEPNFLDYHPAQGTEDPSDTAYYTAAGTNDIAKQVAADEANPYDYLYAVWEPVIEFTLEPPYCVEKEMTLPDKSNTPASVAGTWSLPEGTTGATINNKVFKATEAGDYTLIFTPSDGTCGQATEVTITVNPLPNITATATPARICLGEESTLSATGGVSYMWDAASPAGDGKVEPTETTTYHVTVTDVNGCKKTAEVTVNVNPVVVAANINDQEVCKGSLTEAMDFALTETPTVGTVTWAWTNGNTDIGLAGSGSDNLPSFTATNNGTEPISALITVTPTYTYESVSCPGTGKTFTITVNLTVTGDTTAVECETFTWHGVTYTETPETAPTYTMVGGSHNGCDSVVTLNLTINHATEGDTTAVECETFTWHGVTYTETPETAPTYTIVGGNHNGCDSVVTLNLTINHATEGDTTAVECETFTWHGVTYTETPETAPTYTIVGGNHNGCDSVVTLNLTINHATEGDTTAVECETFTWHGVTYTETPETAPTYTIKAGNHNGCDSVVTLNLTINHATEGDTTAVECETFTWHGVTYIETPETAPTYTMVGGNHNGCDSVVTLHLTINNFKTGDTTAVECDRFTWHGTEYTETPATAPTFTYTAVNGCDSIVTLHLTINKSTTGDTTAVECEKFTWYGEEYTTSGDYEKMFTTAAGCDSIVTLHLTINPLPELTITNKEQTITYGESIQTVVIENENSTLSYTLPSAGFSASTVEGNVEIKSVGLLSVGTYKIPVEVNSDQDPDCGNVKDTIKVIVNPRPLTIKLIASKHYDGTIMEFDQTVFYGEYPDGVTVDLASLETLVEGDYLAAGRIETEDSEVSVYTCTEGTFGYVMEMSALRSGFVVKNAGGQTVNNNYIPQFQVTLTILEPDAYIECVAQNISLADCQPYATIADVQQPEIIGGTGNVSDYILTPSIAEGTPLAIGENLITWTLYTAAGAQLATCDQTVMVNYPPCDPIDYQGHTYQVTRIGSQCWLAENLRNTKYDDNFNEGGNIEIFRPVNDDESTVNAYGYLYSWYSAVGVEEGNNDAMPTTFTDECNGEYIQGACPEGWAVPSHADVNQLRAAIEDDASMLKDFAPQYWLPGANGVNPNSGFNAHAGGHYNSAAGQFEGRLLYAYFWEADSQPGASQVISVVISYYCSNPFEIISSKNDLRPVRCVRKQITAPEEQEPGE